VCDKRLHLGRDATHSEEPPALGSARWSTLHSVAPGLQNLVDVLHPQVTYTSSMTRMDERTTMNLHNLIRTVGSALELKRVMSSVRNFEPNDMLQHVGLEQRRSAMDSVLPALGFFAAGAAIGAGLAVLFTPSTGAEVRGKIAKAATDAKEKVEGLLARSEEDAEEPEETPAPTRSQNGRRAHADTSA